jgi:hypothetical protein
MLLGCFPEGTTALKYLHEAPLEDTGMSVDRCAAMARAAQPAGSTFTVFASNW